MSTRSTSSSFPVLTARSPIYHLLMVNRFTNSKVKKNIRKTINSEF